MNVLDKIMMFVPTVDRLYILSTLGVWGAWGVLLTNFILGILDSAFGNQKFNIDIDWDVVENGNADEWANRVLRKVKTLFKFTNRLRDLLLNDIKELVEDLQENILWVLKLNVTFLFLLGFTLARGRLRKPVPCFCDLVSTAWEYHREGMLPADDNSQPGTPFLKRIISRFSATAESATSSSCCTWTDLAVLGIAGIVCTNGIRKLAVSIVEVVNENYTVKVLCYTKCDYNQNDRHRWRDMVSWRNRSAAPNKPTIKLDPNCHQQMLRVEWITLKKMDESETKDVREKLGLDGGVEKQAPKLLASILLEKKITTVSRFQRVSHERLVSVAEKWEYSETIPVEGIEVKVRLLEDEEVVAELYFGKQDKKTVYIFGDTGHRKLKPIMQRMFSAFVAELVTSTCNLMVANKNLFFKILQAIAGLSMVASILFPWITSSVIQIVEALKEVWHAMVSK